MVLRILKYIGLTVLGVLVLLIISSCTMLGLNYASLETENKPQPRPEITETSLEAWEAGRDALKSQFESNIYGPWPAGLPVELVSRRIVDDEFAGGRARLEELEVRTGYGETALSFYVGLAVPKAVPAGELGLVIGQTFSANCNVFVSRSLNQPNGQPCENTELPWIAEYIFGEYIAAVPFETFFDAGYAYASFYASDLVPDRTGTAPAALAAMAPESGAAPTGAIMAWAYGFSAVIDVVSNESWLDPTKLTVFGHSRHGKAALVAGVWDRRISAVISHQSGFGGAALSRSTTGEGIARITNSYPHWFDPGFAAFGERLDELPVDQHQLLALLAPTPVFLGNGRRDVWSDPNSTFRAADAASKAYEFYGEAGLGASRLTDYRPSDGIAYWLRPGGHGTDQRDIDAIVAFLEAR